MYPDPPFLAFLAKEYTKKKQGSLALLNLENPWDKEKIRTKISKEIAEGKKQGNPK